VTSESEITAISAAEPQFSGIVELNTPEVDSSQGLFTLPAKLVDASNQIAAGCTAGTESVVSNKFIITGRGGLPPSPNKPLNGEAVLTEWTNLKSDIENRSNAPNTNFTRETAPTTIVEAQGWAIAPNGEVILTASAPTVTPNSSRLIPTSCNDS
jgi:large exoprotein involved in heme utilization and adhesion